MFNLFKSKKVQKTNTKTIDITYNVTYARLYARMVWQELFQYYRKHGDLDNMDSFLCDYDILARYFAKGEDSILWWRCERAYTDLASYYTGDDAISISFKLDEAKVKICTSSLTK